MRIARDAGFERARAQQSLDWEDVEEEYLREAWEELKGSFGYDAYDAADDWWVDWGVLRERLESVSIETESNDGLRPISIFPTSMISSVTATAVVN